MPCGKGVGNHKPCAYPNLYTWTYIYTYLDKYYIQLLNKRKRETWGTTKLHMRTITSLYDNVKENWKNVKENSYTYILYNAKYPHNKWELKE